MKILFEIANKSGMACARENVACLKKCVYFFKKYAIFSEIEMFLEF